MPGVVKDKRCENRCKKIVQHEISAYVGPGQSRWRPSQYCASPCGSGLTASCRAQPVRLPPFHPAPPRLPAPGSPGLLQPISWQSCLSILEVTGSKMTAKITIRGARLHNLKNVTLTIPKNQLVVLTGLSGSGKSTLGFDILQKEGQRQYLESLGLVAFGLAKPPVDAITGLSPS